MSDFDEDLAPPSERERFVGRRLTPPSLILLILTILQTCTPRGNHPPESGAFVTAELIFGLLLLLYLFLTADRAYERYKLRKAHRKLRSLKRNVVRQGKWYLKGRR